MARRIRQEDREHGLEGLPRAIDESLQARLRDEDIIRRQASLPCIHGLAGDNGVSRLGDITSLADDGRGFAPQFQGYRCEMFRRRFVYDTPYTGATGKKYLLFRNGRQSKVIFKERKKQAPPIELNFFQFASLLSNKRNTSSASSKQSLLRFH